MQKILSTKSFSVDAETVEKLKALASAEKDRSQSWIIRRLIHEEFSRVFNQTHSSTVEVTK